MAVFTMSTENRDADPESGYRGTMLTLMSDRRSEEVENVYTSMFALKDKKSQS